MKETPQFPIAPLDEKWSMLYAADPAVISDHSGASYDPRGFYRLGFMDLECEVHPTTRELKLNSTGALASDATLALLVVNYLLCARPVPLSGTWISEKQLDGGEFFFRGVHSLPLTPLADRFGQDAAGFLAAGLARGGVRIEGYADAALRFIALPRIPVMAGLWTADDEFPARATFLFDASLDALLPLDLVLALAHCVCVNLLDRVESRPDAG